MELLSTHSLPRAIVHFDGDSFFASVEQQLNHTLRGKPVVTGGERGAATSVSIEAKLRGLRRGMTLKDMKAVCPDVVIVPSDYTAYSIYAKRMYAIVRRYTPDVEEYSIDECFADITGLRQQYRMTYEKIALMIKETLEAELGVTFGVGLAPTKVLAKVASKYRKPAGFTVIYGKKIHEYLPHIPIGDVWGIGRSTTFYLQKVGIKTAYDFALKDEAWLQDRKLSKPYKELWFELRGRFVKELNTEHNLDIGSIMTTRTFTPATSDRATVISQLSKNIENACAKARRYKVLVRDITFMLKTQEFTYKSIEVALPVATTNAINILAHVLEHFDGAYKKNTLYRATGISLRRLVPEEKMQNDLFGILEQEQSNTELLKAIDGVNKKYGRQTLFLGSSMNAINTKEPVRKGNTVRQKFVIAGERRRKALDIPFLGVVR